MILATWLMGCADEAARCKSGFTTGADGLCYEIAGPDTGPGDTDGGSADDTGHDEGDAPTVDDLLADLPPCTSDPTGDGAVDLVAGCVSDVCVGDLPEVVFDTLGEPDSCLPLTVDFGVYGGYALLICDWSSLSITLLDEDLDGVADPDVPIDSIDLNPFYSGATTDGLGMGDEPSCFVGSYTPRDVGFESDGRSWTLTNANFTTFSVYDWTDRSGSFGHDGRVDAITLYGP